MTLLYNDILYIMDSETAIDRRYTDLTIIIHPDMRRFKILDMRIKFKFVTLKEAGLSDEQTGNLTQQEELEILRPMQKAMTDAQSDSSFRAPERAPERLTSYLLTL